MPDVLVRDVDAEDKRFIASYARRHGVSQAEALRTVVRAGIDRLRSQDAVDEAEWTVMADTLSMLADDDFEGSAWG